MGQLPAFCELADPARSPGVKGAGWINDLKIRADFGVTGNQNFDGYLSLNTITGFGDYYYYNGQFFTVWGPSKNVNPDLKWEKELTGMWVLISLCLITDYQARLTIINEHKRPFGRL